MTFIEIVSEVNPDALMADGFDEAIAGMTPGDHQNVVLLYDTEKCIEILSRDMPYEEAVGFFYFNVEGSYMGPHTPKFTDTGDEEEY